MKLHLPKLLLAAILVATGSSSFADDYPVKNSTTCLEAFRGSTANDTVTFTMTVGEDVDHPGDNVYLHDSNGDNPDTLLGKAIINTDVILTNGYSGRTYIFSGGVKGTGDFRFTGTKGGDNQTYTFNGGNGDMSEYSGAMEIVEAKHGTFNFNNTTIGSATAAGSITATHASSRVNLKNSTSYADISTATLGIIGASTVNADVTITGKLDVSGITSAIGGTGTVSLDSAAINISTAQFNNGSYDIFGSGLTISGQATTITVDGAALSTRNTATLQGRTLVMTVVDVIWNGGETAATWNTTDQCWTANNRATAFMQNDRVKFNSSANLTLVSNINVNSMTVSGEGTTVALNTGSYAFTGAVSVQTGSALELTGTGLGLTQISGAGNVELMSGTTTLAAGSATQITGDLIVNSGATLQLANDNFTGGSTTDGTVDLSSLNSLTLKGGQVRYRGGGTMLEKMTVSANSTFNLWDMNSTADNNKFNIKSMVLNSALNITTSWKYNLNIEALTGSGDLTLSSVTSDTRDRQKATINVAQGFTGKILLEGNTAAKPNMDVNISVEERATATIKGKNDADFTTPIASLTLHNGSTLKADTDNSGNAGGHTFSLSTVAVEGAATINVSGDNAYQGIFNIGTLTNAETPTNAETKACTLTLSSNANNEQRSVFNLNGGDFNGDIKIQQLDDGSNRKVALNIKHATATSNATIELDQTNGGSVALGIAADTVAVRGIKGTAGAIYSGEQASGNTNPFAGDDHDRTLIIKTAGQNYSTAATLDGHLNITKQDKGSQTFAGDSPDAIGTVKVEGGELVFSSAVELAITDLTVKSGATLTIGSSPVQTFAEGGSSAVQPFAANAAQANGVVRATGTVLLEGGSTINGGLNLTSTTTLTINNGADGSFSPITLNGALVLPTGGSITLDGNIPGTLAGLAKDGTLNVFKGVTSLTLGDTDYTGVTDLTNYFSFEGLEVGSYSLGYTGAADGGFVYIQKNVPEPTTATLSLLALAALAARRRRKG